MSEQEEFEFRLRLEKERASTSSKSSAKQNIYNDTTVYDPVSGVPMYSEDATQGAQLGGAAGYADKVLRGASAAPVAFASGASKPLATVLRAAPGQFGKNMGKAGDDLIKGLSQQNPILAPAMNLAGEIGGTFGVGGALGGALSRSPMIAKTAPGFIEAVKTGGVSAGGVNGIPGVASRVAGGALTGGTAAGLVNPEDALLGAGIGGAIPLGGKLLSGGAYLAGKGLRGGDVASDVAGLAKRAEELGINIPADRLVNSKPMNALAATLNYIPFSGRAATEVAMQKQMNTALSRTMGQETANVSQAMRNAQTELGGKFDDVLKNNSINVTNKFLDDLTTIVNQATNELPETQGAVIRKQFDDLISHATKNKIDGQTAYNFKRTLDRIGQRNSPEAYYATQMRKTLMDGLNNSLPDDVAKSFQKTRAQYKNMLDLQNVVNRGAEGDVSIGKLAHLNQRVNPEVDEIANIASQFLKSRENPHGALQRFVVGGTAAGLGGLGMAPYLAGTAALGRAANATLNSRMAKDFILGVNQQAPSLLNTNLGKAIELGYKAAPVISAR